MSLSLRFFRSKHKIFLLLALVLCYLYFRGTGDHGLLDPLEGVNASASLNVISRGTVFHPMVGDLPYAGTTLGFWWLNALSLFIFGWSEFAVRFFPVCGALLMAGGAALAARPAGGRAAYYAALVSGTTLLSFFPSQVASAHTLYAALTAVALASFVRGRSDRRFRPLAHAAAAFAFVVYGPAGILLPWLSLLLYSQLVDDPDVLKVFLFDSPGLVLSIVIGLGYPLLLLIKNPMILSLMRYIPSSSAPLSWLPVAAAGLFPWAGYFFGALVSACPRTSEDLLNPDGPRLLLLVWLAVFAASGILSGDGMALATCVPPLAVLTALRMDELAASGAVGPMQRATAFNLLFFVAFLAGGLPALFSMYPTLGSALASVSSWAFFSLLFLLASWHYARKRQTAKLWRALGLIALLSLLPLAGVFDLLADAVSLRPIGLYLRDTLGKGDVVVQYAMNRPSLFFYTARASVLINAPLLPDVPGQRSLGDTDLHHLWRDKARVCLLIDRAQELASPLPEAVSDIYGTGRLLLLSNRAREAMPSKTPQ